MNHAICAAGGSQVLRTLNWGAAVAYVLLLLASGCGGAPQLMPTPNLYSRGKVDPFAEVPPALQGNLIDVMYLTDRTREADSPRGAEYGYKRSRSAAFGIGRLEI